MTKAKKKTLEVHDVPVDRLTLDPENARARSEGALAAIRRSLARFGQQKPIVARNDGVVIAGNGTLEAARELGWDTIAVTYTELDGPDAIAFAIADNRTGELAHWNHENLAAALAEIEGSEEEALDATGFSADEVAALLGGDDDAADGGGASTLNTEGQDERNEDEAGVESTEQPSHRVIVSVGSEAEALTVAAAVEEMGHSARVVAL